MNDQTQFLKHVLQDEIRELDRTLSGGERYLAWRSARHVAAYAQLLADSLDDTDTPALPAASSNGHGPAELRDRYDVNELAAAYGIDLDRVSNRSDEYKQTRKKVGKNIKVLRERLGMDQNDVSREFPYTSTTTVCNQLEKKGVGTSLENALLMEAMLAEKLDQ